jgi:hypothetical protein
MEVHMKSMACLLALVALTSGGRLIAQTTQTHPDFSGTWSGPDGVLTITQQGDALTVMAGNETKVYNLDGSESRFEGAKSNQHTNQMRARTRWTGSALVVAVTTVSPIGTWEDLLVYSLDYGPKLNVVQVGTQTTRPMMSTQTKTYTKK